MKLDQGDDNLVSAITVDGNTSAITRDDQGRILTTKSETSSESVQLTYAGDDRSVSTVQPGDAGEATGMLTAPNGWVIAEQRDPAGYSRYVLTDHLGTAVGEFGKSGVQHSSYSYDAYGQADPLQSSGDMDTTVGFTGQQVDPSTGFTNNDARQYDPVLRAWITTDQYTDPEADMGLALDPANANRLAYAGGNPVNETDPDGHAIRQGNNIIQVVRGKGKIITVDGSKRGRSSGAAASQASRAASAFAAQQAREAATKARWKNNPEKIAMDQRRAKREAAQARIKKSCGSAGVTADWKCKTDKTRTGPSKRARLVGQGAVIAMGMRVGTALDAASDAGIAIASRGATRAISGAVGASGAAISGTVASVTCVRNPNLKTCLGAVGSTAGGAVGAAVCAPAIGLVVACGGTGGIIGGELGEKSAGVVGATANAIGNEIRSGGRSRTVCLNIRCN